MKNEPEFQLFSDLYNLRAREKKKGREELDAQLRGRLWNFLEKYALPDFRRGGELAQHFWCDVFYQPKVLCPGEFNEMAQYWIGDFTRAKRELSKLFMKGKWNACFDCVDLFFGRLWGAVNKQDYRFLGDFYFETEEDESEADREERHRRDEIAREERKKEKNRRIHRLRDELNEILEEESAAWRFDGENFFPVTNADEMAAVRESVDLPSPFQEASAHLLGAIELIRDKKQPDFPNCVKEAMSAVEAAVQAAVGRPGKSLPDCLKKLEVHTALTKAWSSLYGFTSDSGGIRHANNPDSMQIGFREAQYFLVTCSAFVNYLALSHLEPEPEPQPQPKPKEKAKGKPRPKAKPKAKPKPKKK